MPSCRICLRDHATLRFHTEHLAICAGCVEELNVNPEPARAAQARWAQKLSSGMQRNAETDLAAPEEWKRRKARQTLADLDAAVAEALNDWITSLLNKTHRNDRDARIMRAHRRGLLRMSGIADYPGNWHQTAARIRSRDGKRCVTCHASGVLLDVHHIVYLSHHGTNQQGNLVTLCRACHQKEHGRVFDWPEAQDPASPSPLQPPPAKQPVPPHTPPKQAAPIAVHREGALSAQPAAPPVRASTQPIAAAPNSAPPPPAPQPAVAPPPERPVKRRPPRRMWLLDLLVITAAVVAFWVLYQLRR